MVSFSPQTIRRNCVECGKETQIQVNPADLLAWRAGELIQNAMPYLSADEREILISGICGECWDRMFGEDET